MGIPRWIKGDPKRDKDGSMSKRDNTTSGIKDNDWWTEDMPLGSSRLGRVQLRRDFLLTMFSTRGELVCCTLLLLR